MSITFRPAILDQVGLFIGLAGETSGGKTMSAMKLATGIVGRENKFCVIDTENKRASHYAPRPGAEPDFINTFRFDVFDFAPPYLSERYDEIVSAAVSAGYKCIVLDSGSHEHDGIGGYLDRQAEDLEARVERYMKKWPNSREYDVIEKMTPSSWILPKRARNRMRQTLLACSASIPIIFCFRADEKVFSSKDGKLVANNPPIWAPICGKGMPNEMTVFFLLHSKNPGVPVPLKLQDQHRQLFPLDKPLSEASGKLIAMWAHGRAEKSPLPPQNQAAPTESAPPQTDPGAPPSDSPERPIPDAAEGADTEQLIKPSQWAEIQGLLKSANIPEKLLFAKMNVRSEMEIPAANVERCKTWINANLAKSAK